MGAEQSNPQSMCLSTRGCSTNQAMSPLVRQMHLAVMQNDLNKLLNILNLGVDVNIPWVNPLQPSIKDGSTALTEAVSLNHIKAVQVLIDAGASVHTLDRDGMSPLHRSAYHGRHYIAKMLISAGADVHGLDQEGNAPLHMCVKSGSVHNNVKCVVTLVHCGAQVSLPNNRGQIPVHYAASWALPHFVTVLIEFGSNLDQTDNEYFTPFHYCLLAAIDKQHRKPTSLIREVFRRYLVTIKVFLNAGCDSLGMATWYHQHGAFKGQSDDPEFQRWVTKSYPESLKHLCRVYVQNRLGFTNVRHKYCLRKIKTLEIPETLKMYLSRRLITI